MAGIFMLLLMALGALMIWEAIRWSIIEAYFEWTPGASKRKLQRLRKLQQATTAAIEQELERLQGDIRDNSSEPNQYRRQYSDNRWKSSIHHQVPQQQVLQPQKLRQQSRSMSRRRMPRTPSPRARPATMMSTPPWSPPEDRSEPVSETRRICADTCSLMTCEALKEGLRTERDFQ